VNSRAGEKRQEFIEVLLQTLHCLPLVSGLVDDLGPSETALLVFCGAPE